MAEFLLSLFAICLLLFLWAALGHGIWLFVVMILRSIFGTRCDLCGEKFFGTTCGCRMLHSRSRVLSSSNVQSSLENSEKTPSVDEDLEAAGRLIAFTRFHRWLSYEQILNLEQLIARLQVRVAQQQAIGKIEPPLRSGRNHRRGRVDRASSPRRRDSSSLGCFLN